MKTTLTKLNHYYVDVARQTSRFVRVCFVANSKNGAKAKALAVAEREHGHEDGDYELHFEARQVVEYTPTTEELKEMDRARQQRKASRG